MKRWPPTYPCFLFGFTALFLRAYEITYNIFVFKVISRFILNYICLQLFLVRPEKIYFLVVVKEVRLFEYGNSGACCIELLLPELLVVTG